MSELDNRFVLVRTWNGVITVYDKQRHRNFSYFNHSEDKADCLIHMVLDRFTSETTADQIKELIKEINEQHYQVHLYYEESEVKKMPLKRINSPEELQERFNTIPDRPVNVRIRTPGSWNTVNQQNIPLILKHSTVKCDGHYTDDYAGDNANNFGQDAPSDGCKIAILNDLQGDPRNHSFIKCYWDNRDKDFIIYYGQWLSYSAKPSEKLKIVFKEGP